MQHKAKYPHFRISCDKYQRSAGRILTIITAAAFIFLPIKTASSEEKHGIAMHGQLKHPEGFKHFSYVNPDAPAKGRLKSAFVGSFDSMNPLIPKGVPAPLIRNYVYESLMIRAYDEPFSLYGLLAEKIEVPDNRSWISFTLRKEAKFSDGKPVTIDDVIFSHALLRDHGRPNHRTYYKKVQKVEKIGDNTVRFTFNNAGDREMPLIMGLMPVLPKHLITPESFEKTSLAKPVGSGPYIVKSLSPGKNIVFKKNPDYWGNKLPAIRGQYNFDEIQVDFYRDNNTMFEAFKKGLYHVRVEASPSKWALSYDFPAIQNKQVAKEELDLAIPSGIDALVFNTRKPPFDDQRVRLALIHMFDFEWINKTLFHSLYKRTQSYFDRSELSSHSKPADDYEKKLLEPFVKDIDQTILNGTYKLPATDGSGRNRTNMRSALRLLKQAGYSLKAGKLINNKTGQPLKFEILLANRSQERLILTYARSLKKIGIEANLRQVDTAQYASRKRTFDFDMIQNSWGASLSPGNEQSFRWSISAANAEGSYNYPGIKNPAVDQMITALLAAKDRQDFVSSVRALDRVLINGAYVIPLYHSRKQWIAKWNKIQCPKSTSLYGHRIETCWHK